jgi:primosomal protein N' (replication factor Y)
MPASTIIVVAVPAPLRQPFDYLPPSGWQGPPPAAGCRVRVPFGRRRVIGVVVGSRRASRVQGGRLRPIENVLDDAPLLGREELELLEWAAGYYHHPVGDVVVGTLPGALRRGAASTGTRSRRWRLDAAAPGDAVQRLARAPRQAEVWQLLTAAGADGIGRESLEALAGDWRRALRSLETRGWAEVFEVEAESSGVAVPRVERHRLNADQQAAVDAVGEASGFVPFLLDGVTGSGKTEVYLHAIERTVAAGRQALLLVPEIGLTPQLLARIGGHFGRAPAVLHSGLADGERLAAWMAARDGRAEVVVGTRSAVFVPLARPGLIVVDEEHDASFKQQDGFRYHARDVAVVRARAAGIPVLLGTATPSLESLHNTDRGRYRRLRLAGRAGRAALPAIELVDLRSRPLQAGLSATLLDALDATLASGHQALVYLNRRGYATTLMCHGCGWIAGCRRCDARMTLHQARARLCCHHCGSERRPETTCPECGGAELRPLGQGTERVESLLAERFAAAGVVRIDRDTTRRRGSLDAKLNAVRTGRARLLIGTQMLAKGHHFPGVTLVGIVNADAGLFGTDFRAAERVAQQVVQVVGRAGRADHPGRVLIQTHHPDHPLLQRLVHEGYHDFAAAALQERREAGLPPWNHLALLRAEAPSAEAPVAFLEAARLALPREGLTGIEVLGPVPAPMARRGGRHRAQLLLQATRRDRLQKLLENWIPALEQRPEARRVRWSIDVDPIELL